MILGHISERVTANCPRPTFPLRGAAPGQMKCRGVGGPRRADAIPKKKPRRRGGGRARVEFGVIETADSTPSLAPKQPRPAPAPTVDLVGLRDRLLEARRCLVARDGLGGGPAFRVEGGGYLPVNRRRRKIIVLGDTVPDRREVARSGSTGHLASSRRIDFLGYWPDQEWSGLFFHIKIDGPAGDLGRCRRGRTGRWCLPAAHGGTGCAPVRARVSSDHGNRYRDVIK